MFCILLISFVLIANPLMGTPSSVSTPSDNELIFREYTYLKDMLGGQPHITLDQFYYFVEPTEKHIELITGYFLLYPYEMMYKDVIDAYLFIRLIRQICIGTGKNPVRFTRESLKKIRHQYLMNLISQIMPE